MKRKLGRELGLISLPLIFIGAAAWIFAGGGRALLPAKFDNGPARLEFSKFEAVELTPFDVYQKFDWGAKTTVSEFGKFGAPANWKRMSTNLLFFDEVRLVYREGAQWKRVPEEKNFKLYSTVQDLDTNLLTFKVNLKRVPATAQEIRFRGNFRSGAGFRGPIAPGWKSSLKVKHAGLNHDFDLKSKSFDVLVKGPNDALPNPQVAPIPDLEFVAAGWYYKPSVYSLLVRLRTRDGQKLKWNKLRVLSHSLRDKAGQEIVFVNEKGTPQRESDWVNIYRHNYPDLPENEAIFGLDFGNSKPRGGWENVKGPMTLDALVSDRKWWPLRVRATLQQQSGDYKTLAQIPAPASTN